MNLIINPKIETETIEGYYPQIVKAYKTAFAGPPWYEASKCADSEQRCPGGFSPLAVGEFCETCNICSSEPAYTEQELVDRFEEIANTREARWYLEVQEDQVALAALAWVGTSRQIWTEKYPEVSAMDEWLSNALGELPIIWLDEVFANKDVRRTGNLQNFQEMNRFFSTELGRQVTAYRTITPQMVSAARKLGQRASIATGGLEVPDRRDLVIIKNQEEQL